MNVVAAGQVRNQLIDYAERLHRMADAKEREFRKIAQRIASSPTYDWSEVPQFRLANKLHGEVQFLRDRAELITASVRSKYSSLHKPAEPLSHYTM